MDTTFMKTHFDDLDLELTNFDILDQDTVHEPALTLKTVEQDRMNISQHANNNLLLHDIPVTTVPMPFLHSNIKIKQLKSMKNLSAKGEKWGKTEDS